MILDTCLFIDLERRKPEAVSFLADNSSERLCLTVITAGKLACGYEADRLPQLWQRLRHFQIIDVTPEAANAYSRIYRKLRTAGKLIGTNDLWIAAIAMANRLPVVTKNIDEFSRVPGLRIIGY